MGLLEKERGLGVAEGLPDEEGRDCLSALSECLVVGVL